MSVRFATMPRCRAEYDASARAAEPGWFAAPHAFSEDVQRIFVVPVPSPSTVRCSPRRNVIRNRVAESRGETSIGRRRFALRGLPAAYPSDCRRAAIKSGL